MIIEITEEQRQWMVLALAHLALKRPGWDPEFLRPIAEKLDPDLTMYEDFKLFGSSKRMTGGIRLPLLMGQTPLERLGLTARNINCLHRNGMNSIQDVAAATDYDLSILRNYGPKRIEELRACLREYNNEHAF